MSTLRYGEIFDHAWVQIKDRLPLVAGLSFAYFLAIAVLSRLPVIGLFMGGLVHVGYIVCLLKIRDKNDMTFQDFFWGFTDFNRLLQLVLFGLIYGFLLILGFVLLIVPGIYLGVAMSLASIYFVVREQDAVASIRTSIRLISAHWWSMAGLLFLLCLLNIAGAICFVVGLLISMPMTAFVLLRALEILEQNQPAAASPLSPPNSDKADF